MSLNIAIYISSLAGFSENVSIIKSLFVKLIELRMIYIPKQAERSKTVSCSYMYFRCFLKKKFFFRNRKNLRFQFIQKTFVKVSSVIMAFI